MGKLQAIREELEADIKTLTDGGLKSLSKWHGDNALAYKLAKLLEALPVIYTCPDGVPLLCQQPSRKPILTARNYGKWYTLYLLNPDGTVEDAALYKREDVDTVTGCPRIDHNFHPELLTKACTKFGWYLHDVTLEVACGRWALEYDTKYEEADYNPEQMSDPAYNPC